MNFTECIGRLRAALESGDRAAWDAARDLAESHSRDPDVNALGRDYLARLDTQAEANGWR